MEGTRSQAFQIVALGGSKAWAWAWSWAEDTYGAPCAVASLDAMVVAAMGMAPGDVLVDALHDMGDVLVDALHDMVDALHDMGDVLVGALHDMGERPVDALGGS